MPTAGGPVEVAMMALVARAAGLLAAGVVLGLVVNAAHPRGVRFGSFAPPVACTQGEAGAVAGAAGRSAPRPAEAPPPVEVLTLAQVASLCGDPRALVADARPADRFAEGHVSGAIHLPCASSRSTASAAVDLLAGRDTLVVYGDATDDAMPVAEEMRRRAARPGVRIAVLAGGFPAWSRAGMACSSGPCTDCAQPRAVTR
jgi:rhodanese-related sulfurtransferase